MTDNGQARRRCLERLQVVFRTVLDDHELVLSESSSPAQIEGWNQVAHLDVVAAVEEAFGVKFTTSEAWRSGALESTVGLVLDTLLAKLEARQMSFLCSFENAISDVQRTRLLEDCVREQISGVLGVAEAGIDPERALMEQGLTSLSVVELCSRLERELGLSLGPTLVFNYPTMAKVVQFIAGRLGFGEKPNGETAPAGPALDRIVAEIDALSEEDALRLLAKETRSEENDE